jgi:hypothetical protein
LSRDESFLEIVLNISNTVVEQSDEVGIDLLNVRLNDIVVEGQLLEDTASFELLARHEE